MGTQRIFGRTLLLSVLVFALAVSTSITAKAQQPVSSDIRDAVVGAVTAFKGAAPRHGTFINVIAVDRQNQWAYGTIALLTPKNQDAQNGSEELPEGFIWLARRSGANWEVAFEYTPTFLDWAAIAPSEVLDSNARNLFLSARVQPQTASHDNMTIQAAGDPGGNLALPWWPGQAWNFRGGPHGWGGSARPWSSLDFSGGDGRVLAARSGQAYRMCGNTTWIRVVHADGWTTDYYHLVNLAVGNNVPVNYLQYLGDIGTAVDCGGSASSAHVHFAIRLNGSYTEWNGREIGGWTIYEGSSAYQGKAERSFVGGNTIVNVNSTMYNIGVQYQAHVQNIGWQPAQANGGTAGTVGQNLRMEAINISLLKPTGTPGNVDICYEAHVQNIGWQGERCNAQTAGTIGQSLRIEAIKIRLVNPPNRAGVCYRAYVEGIGWQPWYCNNAVAGTTGQGRRLEALQILIMPASLP